MGRAARSKAVVRRSRAGNSKAVVSGFQGASYSWNRGYVYFPHLDTKREIDSYTRYEICRRTRFLYANVGFVRRIINGIARMAIGPGLRPVFKTKDKDWNKAASAHFEARAGQAMVFDLGGRYNFYQAQRALLRSQLKDGDAFAALAKTASSGTAAIRIYESHHVGNGKAALGEQGSWFDGVMTNNANRAVMYRLLTDDGDKAMDIGAENLIPFMDYERAGQSRGLSILYHAINHLLDTAEINGYLKQQIKTASLVGVTITGAKRKGGLTGAARRERGVTPSGRPTTRQVEEAIAGGQALELEEGADFKLVTDTRPHQNTLSYLDYLARDISWGSGFSPEILWDISKLSGRPTYFVLAGAQEVCDEIQAEVRERFCRRFVNYFSAVEMNAGRLPRCQDPQWWMHDYVPPRKLTVDRGRDGKLYIELQGRGMLSLERWYAEQGQDWKREMQQYIDEKAWIKERATSRGLVLTDIFGAGIMGQPPAGAPDSVPGKDPDNDKDDPDTDPEEEDPEGPQLVEDDSQ